MAVIVLAVLLAAQAWSTRNRSERCAWKWRAACRRAKRSTPRRRRWRATVQDQAKDLQVKVGVLENRQTEAQSQQLALEQLYQDLSKNRDEWALAEIEQVLSTASQQLQLAGNVQGALIALQNADRSLSRSDKPQFITIRRAIANDIEKLKALPALDLAGVALRLDNVIAQVDALPMLADEKPVLPAAAERAEPRGRHGASRRATGGRAEPLGWAQRVHATWRSWSRAKCGTTCAS